jgi:putative addiction module component (TIGR02574 family)
MSDESDRTKSEIDPFPVELQDLVQELETGSEAEVDEAWDAELARREAEIRSGIVRGKPAEQVFAEIRARHT